MKGVWKARQGKAFSARKAVGGLRQPFCGAKNLSYAYFISENEWSAVKMRSI